MELFQRETRLPPVRLTYAATDAAVTWRLCVRAAYLRRSEENVFPNVPHGTGGHPEANARKDVGVVPLARMEDSSIRQSDWVERAATGKDASTLQNHRAHCCS